MTDTIDRWAQHRARQLETAAASTGAKLGTREWEWQVRIESFKMQPDDFKLYVDADVLLIGQHRFDLIDRVNGHSVLGFGGIEFAPNQDGTNTLAAILASDPDPDRNTHVKKLRRAKTRRRFQLAAATFAAIAVLVLIGGLTVGVGNVHRAVLEVAGIGHPDGPPIAPQWTILFWAAMACVATGMFGSRLFRPHTDELAADATADNEFVVQPRRWLRLR